MTSWWHDSAVSNCFCIVDEKRRLNHGRSCDELIVEPRYKHPIEIYNQFNKFDSKSFLAREENSTCATLIEEASIRQMCSFELEDVECSVRSRSIRRPIPSPMTDAGFDGSGGLEDLPIDRDSAQRISLSRIVVPRLDIPSYRDSAVSGRSRHDTQQTVLTAYDDDQAANIDDDDDAYLMQQTTATFDLANGKLGSELGRFQSFLLILDIKPSMLIDQFNQTVTTAHGEYGPIEVGDQILACNDETQPRRMLSLMAGASQLKDTVVALRLRKRRKRFTVLLEGPYEKSTASLGLSCNVVGHIVKIVALRKGLITDWCSRHPVRSVCVGDYIEEVNGFVGSDITVALEEWLENPDESLSIRISAKNS